MQVQRSYFADLPIPPKIKADIFSGNVGAFSILDKKTNALAAITDICFKKTNDEIVKELPELKRIWPGSENSNAIQGILPKKAFMRLVNNLHDQASFTIINKQAPKGLSEAARITWEYNNSDSLLATVQVSIPMRDDSGFLALVCPGKPTPEVMEKIYDEMIADLGKANLKEKEVRIIQQVINTCRNYVLNETRIIKPIISEIRKIQNDPMDSDLVLKYNKLIQSVKNVPYSLANAYLKARKQNKLNEFFKSFKSENSVYESVLSKVLDDYSADIFSNVSKNNVPKQLFVSPKDTKQNNFNKMLSFFLDRQAIIYARESRIDMEKTSLSQVKAKMLDDSFHIDNNTEEKFLVFLREEGVIQKVWHDIITEKDIQGFVANAVEMDLLS